VGETDEHSLTYLEAGRIVIRIEEVLPCLSTEGSEHKRVGHQCEWGIGREPVDDRRPVELYDHWCDDRRLAILGRPRWIGRPRPIRDRPSTRQHFNDRPLHDQVDAPDQDLRHRSGAVYPVAYSADAERGDGEPTISGTVVSGTDSAVSDGCCAACGVGTGSPHVTISALANALVSSMTITDPVLGRFCG
jgi:hypothetical protein